MKLLAISDLHVGHAKNHEAVVEMSPHPDDWLILGGDMGETPDHLAFVLSTLGPRFKQLMWVPGNHELYANGPLRGQNLYFTLVDICRSFNVLTPEDPYVTWTGDGGPHVLVPLFIGYDYSFRPADVPPEEAVRWAAESGVMATDERLLDPVPYATRADWCAARLAYSEDRLAAVGTHPTVLINHYPLREELVRLRRIPRFSIWCGTRATNDWHLRYHARVVVSGHLHIPRTDYIDGVRFEEVSLGYPRQRPPESPVDAYVREILPGPPPPTFSQGESK